MKHGPASPFKDDMCLSIMSLPGYSLTDCCILLWIGRHTLWGKTTCMALPETIAREMGGKVSVRTVQVRLGAFEAEGLIECLKSSRGPQAVRETALTEKFWTAVHEQLATVNPKRSANAPPKRSPLRLDDPPQAQWAALRRDSQAQNGAVQAQNGAFQAQPTAHQAQPAALAYKEEPSFLTVNSTVVSTVRESDDDDVRCAPSGEKTPESPPDDGAGLELVRRVVRECQHLPRPTLHSIQSTTNLGDRIKHDWAALALAAVCLDAKIKHGDVTAARIKKPVPYLLTVLAEIRDGKAIPGEVDDAKQRLEALLRPPPALDPASVPQLDQQAALDEPKVRAAMREDIKRRRGHNSCPDWAEVILQMTQRISQTNTALNLAPEQARLRKAWLTDEIEKATREEQAAQEKFRATYPDMARDGPTLSAGARPGLPALAR
jgi:hypothetical protein